MAFGGVLRAALAWFRRALWPLLLTLLLAQSAVPLGDPGERLRRHTRQEEFDFLGWTLDALVAQADELDARLAEVYADPTLSQPTLKAEPIVSALSALRSRVSALQPTVEAVLQEQVSVVLADLGLGLGGKVFPPVEFHFSPLPLALIVSPRTVIRQDEDIQLDPDLSLERQISLENSVEQSLNVSALVVPVGGIGTYPTMVQESTALAWVTETVVHEWVHNYLTLRPLGLNYETSADMRTMNETTASILGKEIGRLVLEKYYPDQVPPPPADAEQAQAPGVPPAFDFRAEMHLTRVTVDAMLAADQVAQAEAYMEARRQVFWEQGYHSIRRLNQAYFAFYGAYADEPGGAAGQDPVGGAVRELRARLSSPAAFLRSMAWMSSFADLQAALAHVSSAR